MEIHSVLPEERAKDAKGDPLPWGYRYADSTRNARQPEESGPFGRNRSLRVTGSRTSRARTGTTPVRQKENTAVSEFGRLLAKEQAKDDEELTRRNALSSTTGHETQKLTEPEAVATECVIYGYAGKMSEWKVISKYEKIVAPGIICEDYPREDPNLLLISNSPIDRSKSVVVHRNLTKDALKKSRIYKGGQHWIKVTFDSYQAADQACSFSPVEIDRHLVYCELWSGRPPADIPLVAGLESSGLVQRQSVRARSLTPAQSAQFSKGIDSAVSGFERAMKTLPRSHTMPDTQYGLPDASDDISLTSVTASSGTAAEIVPQQQSDLRSRSTPHLPSQVGRDPTSQFMTHIPTVKKVVLRPLAEALPPQPTFTERVLRSLPIISWFVSSKGTSSSMIGEGPQVRDDGTWDPANSWYWSFWHKVDLWFGTDFCGVKDD